jgi:hypothetical protein
MIGHYVLNVIGGQIPNIWDKLKKSLHGKRRKMQRGNVKRDEAVACYMQRGIGSWQVSNI